MLVKTNPPSVKDGYGPAHSTYNNVFGIRRVEKGTSRRQRLCGLVP